MENEMHHISVCVEIDGKRAGYVVSAPTESQAAAYAEMFSPRIGYCGNFTFQEAVTRAGMMERNEGMAWGPASLWSPDRKLEAHICAISH